MAAVVLGMDPNPRQLEFFQARARHIAYGGARGGGKSWAMRAKFILLAANYPGLQLLLLRRTLPELRENHILPMLATLGNSVLYSASQREFVFPNGSRIRLGSCEHEKDVSQYQGQEYDVIGMEEATGFTEGQRDFITTCNRSVRTGFSPRLYYTCNPGGVGHAWVKRLFIDREYRGSERPEDYVFIPARVFDNPVLMRADPAYIRILQNLPEHLRRAHLEGDWDALAGQYFSEFRRERHVIRPFALSPGWRRFRSMDWGYKDPCCVLWHCVLPEGRVLTYRELYIRETLARDVAAKILESSGAETIAYTVASPDMWQKRGHTDIEGESLAETFALNGVPLLKADAARVIGWQRCRAFLADAADGRPSWQAFQTCANLIRTLPLAVHDEHAPEDISDHCEDHALEAWRYGLMSRPSAAKRAGKPEPAPYDPLAPDAAQAIRRSLAGGYFDL